MSNQTAVEWLVNEVNSDCLNSTYISPELIKQEKKLKDFHINIRKSDGLSYMCKVCWSKYIKNWRTKNRINGTSKMAIS